MSAPDAALIWCPFPDRDTAREIAGTLLDENLIACANIIGEIESVFDWNGERESGNETAVLFKTLSNQLDRTISRLGELHPYDTPAIVGWRCEKAYPATVDWLRSQVGD